MSKPSRDAGFTGLPEPNSNDSKFYDTLKLGENMIRVLKLSNVQQSATSGEPTINAPLVGQLRVVSLDDHPKFTALSYCWGTEERKDFSHDITLDLENDLYQLKISKTAYQALTEIRDRYGSLTIWIDAISINQGDESEKIGQIKLMAKIYQQATVVYIHLGPGTESTDAAMDWMLEVSRRWCRGTGLLWSGAMDDAELGPGGMDDVEKRALNPMLRDIVNTFLTMVFPGTICSLAQRIFGLPAYKHITEVDPRDISVLLHQSWIQRAWTWQELVLARKPVVLCGRKTVSWDRFAFSLAILDLCYHGLPIDSTGTNLNAEESSSFLGTLASTSGAYQLIERRLPKEPKIDALRPWCSLAECWLRFPRNHLWKKNQSGQKDDMSHPPDLKSFLDYHLKRSLLVWIVSTITSMILVMIPLSWVIIPLINLIKIIPRIRDHFESELSARLTSIFLSVVLVLALILAFWSILDSFFSSYPEVLRDQWQIRTRLRYYCELSMAFAVIPILRSRQAKDPRDLCFSLHGVLEALNVKLTQPEAANQKDVRDVFKDFFLDLLGWDARALILLLDCCGCETPSWTPDWRDAAQRSWLDDKYIYNFSTLKSEPHFEMTNDGYGLFLYGSNIGGAHIIWASPDFETEMPPDMARSTPETKELAQRNIGVLLNWVRYGIRRVQGTTGSISVHDQIRIFEVLEAETIMPSITYQSSNEFNYSYELDEAKLANLSSGFISWIKILEPFVASDDILPIEDEHDWSLNNWLFNVEPERLVQCLEKLQTSKIAFEYHIKICNKIANKRRLFLWSNSQSTQFGTGSPAVQINDRIHLISGLPVPIVMRGVGDVRQYMRKNGEQGSAKAFRIIGPAFIPDIMRGGWHEADSELIRKLRAQLSGLPKESLEEFYVV